MVRGKGAVRGRRWRGKMVEGCKELRGPGVKTGEGVVVGVG